MLTVHLDEELVEGVLLLRVAAEALAAALAAHGVDLVHEQDAGGVLTRQREHVADLRPAARTWLVGC